MSGSLVDAGDATFKAEVLDHKGLVLVDFWAAWCGPCRMLTPTLATIAAELGDKIKIVKVNTEENPQIAMQYRIQQIPFMILFKDGEYKDKMMGNRPKADLLRWLSVHL